MPKKNIIWLALILAVAITASVLFRPAATTDQKDLGRFEDVAGAFSKINDNYYRPVDEDRLLQGAVAGMISRLDEFSAYIPPEKERQFAGTIYGSGHGHGMILEIDNGRARIIRPILGSPACRADVLPGDLIVSVDGMEIGGLNKKQIAGLLEPKSGRTIQLELFRQPDRRIAASVTCGDFNIESVMGFYRDEAGQWVWLIDPQLQIGYLAVREFVNATVEDFGRAMQQMKDIRGLVLDLRGNPGGLLPAGIEIADMFLSRGVILTEVGRGGVLQVHRAHQENTLPDFPLVVLVDAETASAAEIVAGALRYKHRAALVGGRTRGKGCVQSIMTLPGNLGKISLTTKEFLLAGDRPIARRPGGEDWGVEPDKDQEVLLPQDSRAEIARRRLLLWLPPAPSAATRPGTAASSPPATMPTRAEAAVKLRRMDAQLALAVDLFRQTDELAKILARYARQDAAAATRPAEPDPMRPK
ncbi:MAG: hypothetical protein HZA50_15850 [Planctomycetes bacterium]|nr:hypothetical protein [Planctomycetota bacterium]